MVSRQLDVRQVFKGDDEYPHLLSKVDGAPEKLWMRGAGSNELDTPIAIVGSRTTSPDHLRSGRFFLKQLLKLYSKEFSQPFVVVSGLALGTDTMAHQFALTENIPTIGMMGTPINRMFPPGNVQLARAISDRTQPGNALYSEHGPIAEDEESVHDFLRRNRLIAWAALCTLIIGLQSERSGTMTTARHTYRARRPLFFLEGTVKPSVRDILMGKLGATAVQTPGQLIKHLS